MNANDKQVAGSHYRKVPGEQLWDRLVRLRGLPASRSFFVGNIVAYVERYDSKNGIEDLEKAAHYLQKLIELEKIYAESLELLSPIYDRPGGFVTPKVLPEKQTAVILNEHKWCSGSIQQCVYCGVMNDPLGSLRIDPCDPTKLEGKTELCCECGEDYPRGDLIAGEIFCVKCREAEEKRRQA